MKRVLTALAAALSFAAATLTFAAAPPPQVINITTDSAPGWLPSAKQRAEVRTPSPADTYLDDLRGRWIMQGTFGNKAVKYYAVGKRVLGSTWLQLHIIDAAKPSQYEADVFFGYDDKAGDFIIHWLDTSGAAGARVIATGHRDGERLVVVFPYVAGTLRDTFQRDTSRGIWTVLVESQEQGGTWSAFGNLRLMHPMKQKIGHLN